MLKGFLPIRIKVENGKFVQIDLLSEATSSQLNIISNSMEGLLYKEEEIDKFVKNNINSLELAGVKIVSFAKVFFK